MIKEREALENYIASKNAKVSRDKQTKKIIYDYCKENYNLPRGETLDYIDGRKSMQEATEFILFILLDALVEAWIQIDIFGRCICFSNRKIEVNRNDL